MLKFIAQHTMAALPSTGGPIIYTAGTDVNAESQFKNQATKIPIFIHPKALTFPILVALVKSAWTAASVLPVAWSRTVWFPFGSCILLGLLIAVSNLAEEKARASEWISGIIIGLLKSLVVFGAVVGIHKPQ